MRSREDALGWAEEGAGLVSKVLAGLDETSYAEPSALPGWTRKHLVAHLAANGTAVGNLVHWAASGELTPMYSSVDQRAADIEHGSHRSGEELTAWFAETDQRLRAAMAALAETAWTAEVVTAQGRKVPASETPWMRAREVMVHAVDLHAGVGFRDLPSPFLLALGDDVVAKRGATGDGPALSLRVPEHDRTWTVPGHGEPAAVEGDLADVVAYLTGRTAGSDSVRLMAPTLPPWL